MRFRLIAAAVLALPAASALAFDATKASGNASPDMRRQNVDRLPPSGAGGFVCMNATGCDASTLDASPDGTLATTKFGRSIFEALRGSTFYLRPFLTDLACAADQTASINAAILTAPKGAELLLPPGCILISGTILPNGKRLRGVGRNGAATELRYTASRGPAIMSMGDGAEVADLLLTNRTSAGAAVANSAAVAIQLADGVQNPRGQMVSRVRVVGFQDQLDVQSGEFWTATYLDFYNASRYGVRIRNGVHPDSGDGSIASSVIYADNPIGDTAIRMETGGGLKITTTKTLQFNKSFVLAVADGGNTSILMIDGSNSFENPRSGEAVHLGRIEGGKTGIFGHINIEAQLTGSVGVGPGVENVRIATLTRNAPYGVIIQGGDNINVTPGTTFKNVDQAVVIQDPATNVRIGDFACAGCRVKISDQRSTGAGRISIAEQRPISLPAPSKSAAFVPFYEVALAPYRGARLGIEVEGLLSNVGAINSVADVLAIHNGSTVATPTAVTPQKDAGAAPIELQFDTSTTPGAVRVGARVPSAYSNGALSGSITLKVDGRISAFKALP